jgi:hypothetical protein
MKRLAATAALVALAGCGAATEGVAPGALGVSARDAFIEARSVARSWAPDARLRWLEGSGIGADGVALPEAGEWRFHYTATGKTQALVVRVRPLETASEEQAYSSPPGYVIGDQDVGASWIDSRAAVDAVRGAAGSLEAPVGLLLVPTRPVQWLVRPGGDGPRWRVHAETGEVLSS